MPSPSIPPITALPVSHCIVLYSSVLLLTRWPKNRQSLAGIVSVASTHIWSVPKSHHVCFMSNPSSFEPLLTLVHLCRHMNAHSRRKRWKRRLLACLLILFDFVLPRSSRRRCAFGFDAARALSRSLPQTPSKASRNTPR